MHCPAIIEVFETSTSDLISRKSTGRRRWWNQDLASTLHSEQSDLEHIPSLCFLWFGKLKIKLLCYPKITPISSKRVLGLSCCIRISSRVTHLCLSQQTWPWETASKPLMPNVKLNLNCKQHLAVIYRFGGGVLKEWFLTNNVQGTFKTNWKPDKSSLSKCIASQLTTIYRILEFRCFRNEFLQAPKLIEENSERLLWRSALTWNVKFNIGFKILLSGEISNAWILLRHLSCE